MANIETALENASDAIDEHVPNRLLCTYNHTGGTRIGGTPAAGTQFRLVSGTVVVLTDGSGYATITFASSPFATGHVAVAISSYDVAGAAVQVDDAVPGINSFKIFGYDTASKAALASAYLRVDYVVIGW